MPIATIAVKGSASDDFPADYATVHFGHELNAAARSEALAEGNAAIAQLRDTVARLGAGVRDVKVRSLRVQETFNYVGPDRVRAHAGWLAQIGGEIDLEPGTVPTATAALIKLGVRIHFLSWQLNFETALQAHRAVRRRAVADAREAANDFALALDATLGNLITLADPGLLDSDDFEVRGAGAPRRFATAASSASSASWDEVVDLDPELITIYASVEASYEVTLP
jgi:uncharacterized protein YggE